LALLTLAVLLAPGLALGRARADSALPTLYVAYAMNCTFTIVDDAGKAVSSIVPGYYQVQVTTPVPFASETVTENHDFTACKGSVQFQLTGPGVNLATTLDDGDGAFYQFTATFKAGATYTAQDNNQPLVARAVFTTTATGSPSSPALPAGSGGSSTAKPTVSHDIAGSAVVPFEGNLAATIDAAGKLALEEKGKAVGTLTAGLYTFTVVDMSATRGFTIQRVARGVKSSAIALTGVGYKGTHAKTIDLKAGQWTFFSPGGKKTYFISVA
jgi:hypothetical protein